MFDVLDLCRLMSLLFKGMSVEELTRICLAGVDAFHVGNAIQPIGFGSSASNASRSTTGGQLLTHATVF